MVDTDALRTWALVSLFVSAAAGCGGEGGSDDGGARGSSSTGGSADASTSALETSGGVETTSSGSTAEPDGSTGGSTDTGGSSSGDDGAGLVEARPYELIVPDDYDPGTPLPLVLTLHGYGASGPLQSVHFRFTQDAQTRGYLVATPNGLLDAGGSRFWNATDACCDFDGQGVDDVAYLDAVLDDVIANYSVALDQIYVVGHSNGGFMAHRLGCEIGDRIAAIVSLAGATWSEPDACAADSPVHVLQIHGTDDDTVGLRRREHGRGELPLRTADGGELGDEERLRRRARRRRDRGPRGVDRRRRDHPGRLRGLPGGGRGPAVEHRRWWTHPDPHRRLGR